MQASISRRVLFVAVVVALMVVGLIVPAHAEPEGVPGADPTLYAPPFTLDHPVEGRFGFSDTFGAIRDGGSRLHQGVDISAPKTTPVLAAAAGVVSRVDVGENAGLYVEVRHVDGWRTLYLHLNNDEPPPLPASEPICKIVTVGETATEDASSDEAADHDVATDDPPADGAVPDEAAVDEVVCTDAPVIEQPLTWGIPPDIFVGAEVAVGDVVGFVGTSGNARSTTPHLHFEVRMPDRTPVNPHPLLTGESGPSTLFVLPDVTDVPITVSIDVVGHVDPTGGFNAAVWAHGGVAYLGTLGRGQACPATGVRRYAVTDPAGPVELVPISEGYPGTSTEAIWVGTVDSPQFSGDLAIVAHRSCDLGDGAAFGGLAFYDVTDSTAPVPLGTYDSGPGTQGVQGFDVWVRQDAVLVVAAVPNSLLDHTEAVGDVQVIDVTDPTSPVTLSHWDFRRDAPETMREAILEAADPRDLHARSVTLDGPGERAFVSFWDAGVVVLDLADPSQPRFVGRTASVGPQEGKAHSTALDAERGILVVNHRGLDPLDDVGRDPLWRIGVVFDVGDSGDPTLVAAYSIEDARPDSDGRLALSGLYTAHDSVMVGDYLYAVWLSGGLRVVDLSDPAEPIEVASFVPPTQVDPQRSFASPNGNIAMPLAWSVHVVDDLVFVSDLNTGLWILRLSDSPTAIEGM